jgi:predicted P-loop ATPase/GTPase
LPKVSSLLSDYDNIKESAFEFYKYLQEYLDTIDGYITFNGKKLYITKDDKITQDERDVEIKASISIVDKYYEITEISLDGVTNKTFYTEITKEQYDNPFILGNARKVIIKAAEI